MTSIDPQGVRDRRPHSNLYKYYVLESLLLGPFFWIALIARTFRYRTLRYHWDDQGITARWGAIFRREISLDFERIQDIHLSSNLFERWLGLAKVEVQTASGSSTAEMRIEGLKDFQEVRDFLYSRMRGVREAAADGGRNASREAAASSLETSDATASVVRALEETTAELRALRLELAKGDRPRQPPGSDGGSVA